MAKVESHGTGLALHSALTSHSALNVHLVLPCRTTLGGPIDSMFCMNGARSQSPRCLLKLAVGYVDELMASVITDAGITRLLTRGVYNVAVVPYAFQFHCKDDCLDSHFSLKSVRFVSQEG